LPFPVAERDRIVNAEPMVIATVIDVIATAIDDMSRLRIFMLPPWLLSRSVDSLTRSLLNPKPHPSDLVPPKSIAAHVQLLRFRI
jgi:hypothetical protein